MGATIAAAGVAVTTGAVGAAGAAFLSGEAVLGAGVSGRLITYRRGLAGVSRRQDRVLGISTWRA